MKRAEISDINEDRMKEWMSKLTDAHSTVVIALGVGHDHKRGELHICVPEDVGNAIIAGLLRKAAAMIETQERRTT